MKGICIGYKGTENIMQLELNEIIGKQSLIEDSVCIFETDNEKDFAKLCYIGQSFCHVLQLIESFELNSLDDVNANADYSFLKGKKIKVSCERTGEHDFKSVDASEKLADSIFEKVKCSADFRGPDIIIMLYIYKNKAYVGIDYAGFDLSKRDYKVFLSSESLKGPIAYFMIRYSGYVPGNVMLDPFCGSGTIPIEAAIFASGFPLNKFRKDKFIFIKMAVMSEKELEELDEKKKSIGNIHGADREFRHVEKSKKNAKIAGINKEIEFTRNNIEQIDIKFKDDELDFVITNPPEKSKRVDERKIAKLYSIFFENIRYIIKKNGIVCCVSNELLEKAAIEHKFEKVKEAVIEKNSHETC
ncbi:methyltransferase, partial [Candidatus Woesearchaeota archaeon]|nr:methyltransferase [Candidatus Woesearchaeota archaeon]